MSKIFSFYFFEKKKKIMRKSIRESFFFLRIFKVHIGEIYDIQYHKLLYIYKLKKKLFINNIFLFYSGG